MDSILKKRIADSGLAALGLALIMKPLGELPAAFAIALFGLSAEPINSAFVWPALIACVLAIVGGIFLMRRFIERTGTWFVAAIVTWFLAGMFLTELDPMFSTLVLLAVTWFELYLNAAPVESNAAPIGLPAPVEEMNLIKTETSATAPQTDVQPLDPAAVSAAINVAPGKPLYSALGLIGAMIGAQLIVLGLMNTTFAAFDSLGDSFSGLPRSADPGADSANYQIVVGVILVGIGITAYTLFKGPKK